MSLYFRASNKAAVIRKQAQVDSEIYLKLLQTEVGDLSSYLAVEAFSSAQKPVRMNLHAPWVISVDNKE